MSRLFLVLFCAAVAMIACQSPEPQDITGMEKLVAKKPTEENVTKLMGMYEAWLEEHPEPGKERQEIVEKVLDLAVAHERHEEALHATMMAQEMKGGDPALDQDHVQKVRELMEKLGKDTYVQPLGDVVFNDSTGIPDPKAAARYIEACEAYALAYKGTEQAAEYLYKASETARAMGRPEVCIGIYDRLIKDYPNSKRARQALFLKGFTYDNDLHKYDEAKAIYKEFIAKYPEDEFAGSAEFLLENLGKSDDELLEALQKKQESQEAHAGR